MQFIPIQAAESGLFTFETFNNDSEVAITDYPETSSLAEVFVPATIEGLPVTRIGIFAFRNSQAEEIHLPEGITTIEPFAFTGSSNLLRATVPNAVTVLERFTFSNCTALSQVTLPENLTAILEGAFDNTGLSSIEIPETVEVLGLAAFRNNPNLQNITLPDAVTSIGGEAFRGCSNLRSATFLGANTQIGARAFQDCIRLLSVTLPTELTSISINTFRGCTALPSLQLPDTLMSIGDNAFQDCENLDSLTIQGGFTTFGDDVFLGCTDLRFILFLGDAPVANPSTFSGATNRGFGIQFLASNSGFTTPLWNEAPASASTLVRLFSADVLDSDSQAEIRLTLTQALQKDLEIAVTFEDGTALAGDDFDGNPQQIIIPAGQTEVTFSIPLISSNQPEAEEIFTVVVSDAGIERRSTVSIAAHGFPLVGFADIAFNFEATVTRSLSGTFRQEGEGSLVEEETGQIIDGSFVINLNKFQLASPPTANFQSLFHENGLESIDNDVVQSVPPESVPVANYSWIADFSLQPDFLQQSGSFSPARRSFSSRTFESQAFMYNDLSDALPFTEFSFDDNPSGGDGTLPGDFDPLVASGDTVVLFTSRVISSGGSRSSTDTTSEEMYLVFNSSNPELFDSDEFPELTFEELSTAKVFYLRTTSFAPFTGPSSSSWSYTEGDLISLEKPSITTDGHNSNNYCRTSQ